MKRGVWDWTHPNPRPLDDSDAKIEMVSGEHGLTVSITDDHAVDSYNAEFTSVLTMPRQVVAQFHAWLGEMLQTEWPTTGTALRWNANTCLWENIST